VIGRKQKSPSRLRRDALQWQVWQSTCTVESAGVEANVNAVSVGIGVQNVVVCKWDVGTQTDVIVADATVDIVDVDVVDDGLRLELSDVAKRWARTGASAETVPLFDSITRHNENAAVDDVDATVDNVDRKSDTGIDDTVGDIVDATVEDVNQTLAAGSEGTGDDSGDAAVDSVDDVNGGATVEVEDMSSGDSGDNDDGDEVRVTVEPVRRSTRTTKGRHSNPNRLPQTAVQQEAVVVARAMRPSFQDFSQVVLNLQQQTLNLQQQTFSQTVQVLKDYCGDCE
jgi:hypothetical protein